MCVNLIGFYAWKFRVDPSMLQQTSRFSLQIAEKRGGRACLTVPCNILRCTRVAEHYAQSWGTPPSLSAVLTAALTERP